MTNIKKVQVTTKDNNQEVFTSMKKSNFALIVAGLAPALAMAQEHATAASPATTSAYWAAGICMGVAAAVASFSQSRAAVAALEGIGRNPSAAKAVFTPLILSLALIESLVLFAFVVAFSLAGK
jgi:F-type H+-transporting ATPase subunit c